MDPKEYKGTMPACFEKGLPRCPAEAVIPTMTVETDEGIKKLSNTVVHVVQNNATYYVDDKHRITEICTEPVERNDYDFDNNPEGFRGQIVFDYATNRAAYFNNAGQSFSLVTDNIDFNALSNRPKYNGVQMTSSTNIPLVPTRVSELANDAHYQTESDVQTTVSNAVATHNTSPTAHNDIRQALADEVSARTAGVKKVADDLADEITARTNADTALEAADTALGNRITAETTNRTNADTALGTRITNETTARQNADSALQSDITAEETARKAADKTLQDNIDAEANTRSSADTTLQSNITAEATARGNADTALGTRITDETTNRTDADTALGGRIDTEITNRTNADTALGGRIDTEITNRTNADTAIENKLNRTVLYDLEMETDANNVTFVEDKVNLKTGGTSTERDVIPAASPTTAGTISASEYVSLVDAEEKITALLEGAVAIDNLPANPTQQQLTDAWLAATGKTELINRASIYDSANQLVHTYYTNVSEWEDSPAGGQITIDQFTNSAAGIIKGSTTDGNVSANLDGTGTVSGWTALKNTVAGKQDALTAGSNISISGSTISATDTTYSAGTGLSLTGTTFAVDTTTIAQKSDIPTVNNATLTIQKNGTDVQTFTANSASNKTANITVPTKTSELTNDSNFPVDANYVHTDNNFTTTLKNKLDGIAAGAEVNQNAFSTVKVGSTNVAADSKTDTLELVAGSNITLTPDATNDKVTIASTDTNTTYTFANGTNGFTVTPSGGSAQTVTVTPSIANATSSTAGLMSAADKAEFDLSNRVERRLIADGTAIPSSADLNTATYLSVGRYHCYANADAATLANCPTTRAFVMEVFNSTEVTLDNETTATWRNRIRMITDYRGYQWVQWASSASTAGQFSYSSWQKIVWESDMNTELAKKVDVASIDIGGQTTTLLALTKALGTAGTNYARWFCKNDGESSGISDKPTGATNNSFVCVAYATRRNNTTDYKYHLVCYIGGQVKPYVAEVTNSTSSISWSQEALTSDIKDATLTIQKNGTTVQTFTANASSNKTANITVPTQSSDLSDGTNLVKKEDTFTTNAVGSNLTLTGTAGTVFSDVELKGDTFQQTYTGKNLWNKDSAVMAGTWQASGSTYSNGTLRVPSSGTSGVSYAALGWYNFEVGKTYTITFKTSGDYYQFRLLTSENQYPSTGQGTGTTTTHTLIHTPVSTENLKLACYTTVGSGKVCSFYDIQIEVGSTATPYEPYVGGAASPSPSYPQEIETATGRQVVNIGGKNICNSKIEAGGYNNSTGNKQDVSGYRTADKIPVAPNTEYIWSDNGSGVGMNVIAYDISGTYISQITSGAIAAGHSFTTPANCYYVTGWRGSNMTKLQLEKGSTVTAYTPCQGPLRSYEINLGKNLFDKAHAHTLSGYVSAGNVIVGPGTVENMCYIECEPNTTYTVQKENTGTNNRFGLFTTAVVPEIDAPVLNTAGTHGAEDNSRVYSITTPSNAKYLGVFFAQPGGASTPSVTEIMATIQIEKGSTATTYAPYFTPIELCKISTYQDKIYKSGDKWYLHKETASVDWGTLTWTMTTGSIYGTTGCTGIKYAPNNTTVIPSYAEKYIGRQGSGLSNYTNYYAIDTNKVNVQKGSSTAPDPTGMFYYPLATATDTEITNTALISQLDNFYNKAATYANTTYIDVDGDLPVILDVDVFQNNLASTMAGINARFDRLIDPPVITMTSTDPGEGQPLEDNHFIAVYSN